MRPSDDLMVRHYDVSTSVAVTATYKRRSQMTEVEPGREEAAVSSSSIKRRLAAVAFADVAGFSRLMALNDVETVRRWKDLRMQILEPHMVRQGGRVAEIAGDAVLVEFPSVVNAVRWAADVQRSSHQSSNASDPLAVRVRIGINVEDLIDDDGILQGDGVNIASRIHQAAEPGQIVVTAAVRDFVMNRLPVAFHDLGTPPMKNIVRPIRVFAVEWTDSGKLSVDWPYLQWSSHPTVAVLPFRTIGGHNEDSYFGEGITDEIITELSRNRSLFVIARTFDIAISRPSKGRAPDSR
jgi:class 3 adenylate cyclase